MRASKDGPAYFAENWGRNMHSEKGQERGGWQNGIGIQEGCFGVEQSEKAVQREELPVKEELDGTTESIPTAGKEAQREQAASNSVRTGLGHDSLHGHPETTEEAGMESESARELERDGGEAMMLNRSRPSTAHLSRNVSSHERLRKGVSPHDHLQASDREKGILTSRSTESVSSVKSRLHTSPSGPVLFSDRKKVSSPAGELGDGGGGWGRGDSGASVPRKLRSTVIASRPLPAVNDPYETDSQSTRHVPTYRKPNTPSGGLVRPTTARLAAGRKKGDRVRGREEVLRGNAVLEDLEDEYDMRKEAFESQLFRVAPVDVTEL